MKRGQKREAGKITSGPGTAGRAGRMAPAKEPIAGDRGFLTYVLDQLAAEAVTSRAMFGGHGLYLAGRFFAIVYRGRLYLKVDDASRPEFERHGMGPFSPGPGTTMRGYFEVPPAVLEDSGELRRWSERASRIG